MIDRAGHRARMLLLALGACATDGDGASADFESAIVGGAGTSGDPAVLAIRKNGLVHCTGTLVAPSVVLTAAHCVRAYSVEELDALFLSSRVKDPEPRSFAVRFSQGFVHPDYQENVPDNDVAVLRLERPVDIAPLPILRQELGARAVGLDAKLVGYGAESPEERSRGTAFVVGRKMQIGARILEVKARTFLHEAVTCSGDSGGPGFLNAGRTPTLVGIHSMGSCGVGDHPSTKVRADVHLGFVLPLLGEQPVTPPPRVVAHRDPPRDIPEALTLEAPTERGAAVKGELRCPPGKESLAVSLSGASGQANAYLRAGAEPTPNTFDLDAPSNSSFLTESGTLHSARWYVLVRNDRGGPGVRLTVECM